MTTERHLGRIKWFNSSKGFGFVTDCKQSNDVFVHHTGIQTQTECWKTLYPGEYVHYELHVDDEGKSHAVNITGVESGPLLCETRHELNRQKTEYKKSKQQSSADNEH